MKTLEFENCGLQEMNVSEMKSVEGGTIWLLRFVRFTMKYDYFGPFDYGSGYYPIEA